MIIEPFRYCHRNLRHQYQEAGLHNTLTQCMEESHFDRSIGNICHFPEQDYGMNRQLSRLLRFHQHRKIPMSLLQNIHLYLQRDLFPQGWQWLFPTQPWEHQSCSLSPHISDWLKGKLLQIVPSPGGEHPRNIFQCRCRSELQWLDQLSRTQLFLLIVTWGCFSMPLEQQKSQELQFWEKYKQVLLTS